MIGSVLGKGCYKLYPNVMVTRSAVNSGSVSAAIETEELWARVLCIIRYMVYKG